jgi:hypothetical protein
VPRRVRVEGRRAQEDRTLALQGDERDALSRLPLGFLIWSLG